MREREMLELAAKAAGISGSWGTDGYFERNQGFIPNGWIRAWDPRNDYDDAFTLLMQLPSRTAYTVVFMSHDDKESLEQRKRRLCKAIFNAAVEIGKSMP